MGNGKKTHKGGFFTLPIQVQKGLRPPATPDSSRTRAFSPSIELTERQADQQAIDDLRARHLEAANKAATEPVKLP